MNLGAPEVVVVLLIAVVFFGPTRLPQLGRDLGNALREFKRGANALREELEGDEKDASHGSKLV